MKSDRFLNFLVYFIPFAGWLIGLIVGRRSLVTLYHACQAFALTLGLILVPLGWALFAWLLAWIPIAGPVISLASFSLVVAAIPALVVAWVLGMANALRDEIRRVPVFGAWGEQLFRRLTRTLQDDPQVNYVPQEAKQ